MKQWNTLASKETVKKTIAALMTNGMNAVFVQTGKEAKQKMLGTIPPGSGVMTMTSITLDAISAAEEINASSDLVSIRNRLYSMDRKTQSSEMQKLGAAPEYTVGSVHAVTQDGKVLIASNSGSQLPAYAYGSTHVIWVVGTQKIVKNIDEGIKRIYEYSLPLESERAKKAYGVPGSNVNKLLIINREIIPGRITIIFVNEKLGF